MVKGARNVEAELNVFTLSLTNRMKVFWDLEEVRRILKQEENLQLLLREKNCDVSV